MNSGTTSNDTFRSIPDDLISNTSTDGNQTNVSSAFLEE